MDDVDRLFDCFKCGFATPKSAVMERKKCRKTKFTQQQSPSTSSGSPQPRNTHTKETNVRRKSANQFSPVVFYGSPDGVPAKRPTRLLRLLHEIRKDLFEQDSLNSRKVVWETFPRQDRAIEFMKKHPHASLFSYQDHINGQRRFLVSTYKEFWRRYKNMDPRFRHHYEVISEGLPCHLYFDLEYNKKVNPNKNGDELVDLLISVILDALYEKYSIQGCQDWVVELDSSTKAEKFSRHLIVRIPRTAFKDNSHVGAFVAEICSRICNSLESGQGLEKLFVSKDSSSDDLLRHIFVDTAVYSRNRCFRLALSSKAGKSSVLLPTGRFKCKNMNEEDMFLESLICRMDDDCQKLLICKMDLDCKKILCFDSELNYKYESRFYATGKGTLSNITTDMPTSYFIGKSPFPALDKFVETVASTGSISGKIRSWYWFSEEGLMIYSMSRNRYCERIGREHKSNHVMYIIDFRRGVYYQKCYDPDCKGYRSPFREIPSDAIPDTLALSNSTPSENNGSLEDDLLCPFAQEFVDMSCSDNQSLTDSSRKNDWWLEAMRFADEIENKQSEMHDELERDDEDVWWMAVERSASQMACQKIKPLLLENIREWRMFYWRLKRLLR
ncbi:hypothetical protein Sjap_005885 [Stephania japonica]|uniref:DNA-directed primase/polymerase protein n=1 Tax=Stephania japonica TaxID=461633 RepID=A0AAP0K7C0_9MAGN